MTREATSSMSEAPSSESDDQVGLYTASHSSHSYYKLHIFSCLLKLHTGRPLGCSIWKCERVWQLS